MNYVTDEMAQIATLQYHALGVGPAARRAISGATAERAARMVKAGSAVSVRGERNISQTCATILSVT